MFTKLTARALLVLAGFLFSLTGKAETSELEALLNGYDLGGRSSVASVTYTCSVDALRVLVNTEEETQWYSGYEEGVEKGDWVQVKLAIYALADGSDPAVEVKIEQKVESRSLEAAHLLGQGEFFSRSEYDFSLSDSGYSVYTWDDALTISVPANLSMKRQSGAGWYAVYAESNSIGPSGSIIAMSCEMTDGNIDLFRKVGVELFSR